MIFWDVDYRKIGKYFCEKLNGVSIKGLDNVNSYRTFTKDIQV